MSVTIILDKIYNKSVPKPTSLRPGYDIEYSKAHCHIYSIDQIEKMVEMEKLYDNLSIIRSYETPQQWAIRVKSTLQTLIAEGYRSFYHVFCLFGSFGQGVTNTCYDNWTGRELPISYHRPSIHKSQMAICFKCWKLVKITEVKPRKVYYDGWRRWGYEIKSEDLMKDHWDNSCFKAETATIVENTMPSAPEIRNLWNNRSNMPAPLFFELQGEKKVDCTYIPKSMIKGAGNLAEAYFDSVREIDLISFN